MLLADLLLKNIQENPGIGNEGVQIHANGFQGNLFLPFSLL